MNNTNNTLHKIPFFERIAESKNILLAGAGGGFDIYSGIPILLNLLKQGKNVVLANFSFTQLDQTTAERVTTDCYKISSADKDESGRNYFPEKYLCWWLEEQKLETPVYGFLRTGVQPLKKAYEWIAQKHEIDTVVLVDGGTDSLMFGDEETLGTPQEDITSMAAVFQTDIAHKYLVSVGFGIDDYHGVSHYRFLENVATIMKTGGYLGLFQPTLDMEESQGFISLLKLANRSMLGKESIVANSIKSALEGEYGDYHTIGRTFGSKLWINPLMTIYWCFELEAVVRNVKYYTNIKDTNTIGELNSELSKYRRSLSELRDNRKLPV